MGKTGDRNLLFRWTRRETGIQCSPMPRLSRFVHPGTPYHVTHRGNRRQVLFVDDEDRRDYVILLREYAAKAGMAVWGYCLMTNHVHLLVVPSLETSLARGVGLAHRRFAQRQNFRHRWTGHLFEGRYFSCALDGHHLGLAFDISRGTPYEQE